VKFKILILIIGVLIIMSFEKCFAFTIGEEGGYANHPKDKGGETKWGISKNQYPNLDIPILTKEDARTIYLRDYWEPSGANLLPDKLSLVHFDSAVNHGVPRAIKLLQAVVCVFPDGKIGPKTKAAIERDIKYQGERALVMLYLQKRYEFYKAIVKTNPGQKVFLKGWLNRLDKLRQEVGDGE